MIALGSTAAQTFAARCPTGSGTGAIVVGKVEGHLLDEHRQKIAAKPTIGTVAFHNTNDSDARSERTFPNEKVEP